MGRQRLFFDKIILVIVYLETLCYSIAKTVYIQPKSVKIVFGDARKWL